MQEGREKEKPSWGFQVSYFTQNPIPLLQRPLILSCTGFCHLIGLHGNLKHCCPLSVITFLFSFLFSFFITLLFLILFPICTSLDWHIQILWLTLLLLLLSQINCQFTEYECTNVLSTFHFCTMSLSMFVTLCQLLMTRRLFMMPLLSDQLFLHCYHRSQDIVLSGSPVHKNHINNLLDRKDSVRCQMLDK